MYSILRDQMEGVKKEVIDFTRELVRTPSESLNESGAAALVEKKMKDLGYHKVLRDDFGNVIGVLYGRESEPTLLLESHLDTVEADSAENWKHGAFSGELHENRIYGLGASDCKGGLAAQIYAGALIERSLLPLRGNLVVAATVAEQNGVSVGLQVLMERTLPELGLKPSWAILGEPTGLGLYYGHDGWLELEIRIEGANPFHVDDAVRAIYNDLTVNLASRRAAAETPEEMSVRFPRFENPVDYRGVRRGSIQLQRRVTCEENAQAVIGQLKHQMAVLTQPVREVAVEVAVRQEVQRLYNGKNAVVQRSQHAWSTDPFHPLVERSRQALAAAGCKSEPGKWKMQRLGMGTAGGTLVARYGVPTVGYGPGKEEAAHAVDEYVEVNALLESVMGGASIAHSLIGIPVYGWTSDEI